MELGPMCTDAYGIFAVTNAVSLGTQNDGKWLAWPTGGRLWSNAPLEVLNKMWFMWIYVLKIIIIIKESGFTVELLFSKYLKNKNKKLAFTVKLCWVSGFLGTKLIT